VVAHHPRRTVPIPPRAFDRQFYRGRIRLEGLAWLDAGHPVQQGAHTQPLEDRERRLVVLVGQHPLAPARLLQGGQHLGHAGIEARLAQQAGGIGRPHPRHTLVQRRIDILRAALDQQTLAIANARDHEIQRNGRGTIRLAHGIDGSGQIGARINQRSIQIVEDQTATSHFIPDSITAILSATGSAGA